jgi:hypothetical protein
MKINKTIDNNMKMVKSIKKIAKLKTNLYNQDNIIFFAVLRNHNKKMRLGLRFREGNMMRLRLLFSS